MQKNQKYTMSSFDIRKKFVEYFVKNWHKHINSVPLLAQWDSTLLFVNSWMFPLVPYLLWEKHPMWNRLVNFQRSFRTDDIDEIWDQRHTTFFEMLWNWSLWDYFKKEQLNFWYWFLIDEMWLDPKRIYQSVFWWDNRVEIDKESIEVLQQIYKKYWVSYEIWPATIWKGSIWPNVKIDFEKYRIFPYIDKNRWQRWDSIWEVWWPDTETFYDTWKPHDSKYWKYCHVNCDCWRFLEIWNSVFIQYILTEKWWNQIKNKNVDFWWWLERIVKVVNWLDSIFESDLFIDIISFLEKVSWKIYEQNKKEFEIVCDHIRASVFLIMDWWIPSNKDQWYFVRRLLRRAIVFMYKLKINIELWHLSHLAWIVIETYKDTYPNMKDKREEIISIIKKEENQFSQAVKKWIQFLEKVKLKDNTLMWVDIFELHATHWFQFELIKEIVLEQWIGIDEKWFYEKLEEHKNISKAWLEKKFKSWLADNSEQTTKYHTATHLLHIALKKLLWDKVEQKWSNNTKDRLRFDFSYNDKLTQEQIINIENLINWRIKNWFEINFEEMTKDEALKSWAIWLFEDRYWWILKVYQVKDFNWNIISKEICSWPHVKDSTNFWNFKIIKEESAWSWIRRIKAILE